MTDETNAGTEVSGEDTAAVLNHAAGGDKTYLPEGGEAAPKDEQPGDDAAAAAEAKPEGEQPPPKRTSAQERIDELTRARREAEREAAHWRQIAQQGAKPQEDRQPAPSAHLGDAEPNPEDFQYGETDPGFIRALARFEAKQAYRAEAQQHQRATQAHQVEQSWDQRQQDFAKAKPDYFEVIDREWVCSQPMADAIRTSDDGAAVAYHLAQHPDEARRIAAMNPLAQIREIGRIEARIATPAADPKPQPKTVSDAPPVAPQVRGVTGKFKPAGDTDDFAAFQRAYLGDG